MTITVTLLALVECQLSFLATLSQSIISSVKVYLVVSSFQTHQLSNEYYHTLNLTQNALPRKTMHDEQDQIWCINSNLTLSSLN